MKKPSKERRERIIKYAKEHAGISVGELAEIFVLSEVQAVRILKEAGMFKEAEGKAKKAPGFSWDEDAVFRLKAYLVQGMKNAEIAKNLGCKPQAVADYKKRHREELAGYIGNGSGACAETVDKRNEWTGITVQVRRRAKKEDGIATVLHKEEPLAPGSVKDSGGVPDAGIGGVRGTAPGTEGVGRNPSDENYYNTDFPLSQDTVGENSGKEFSGADEARGGLDKGWCPQQADAQRAMFCGAKLVLKDSTECCRHSCQDTVGENSGTEFSGADEARVGLDKGWCPPCQDTVGENSGTEGENDMDREKRFEEILESADEGCRKNTGSTITGGSDDASEEAYEKWLRKYMDAECKSAAARANIADAILLLGVLQIVLDEGVVYDSPCGAFTFGTSGKERLSFLISREAIRLLREADGSLFEI